MRQPRLTAGFMFFTGTGRESGRFRDRRESESAPADSLPAETQ
jgi:hypothetical protein